MKLLLSPAKLMSLKSDRIITESTTPIFLKESTQLINFLKQYNATQLEKVLGISTQLTLQNWERFQDWEAKPTIKNGIQAILGYKGEVYRSLQPDELSANAINYLQNNAFIFSGLYGVLKPLDVIMPYRLEMKTKLAINKKNSLYDFWEDSVTKHINQNTKENEVILNLTSDEYLKTLNQKKLNRTIVTCRFQTLKNGKLSSVMMHLKSARGLIARFCAENSVDDLESVKKFNLENYYFSPQHSTDLLFTFIKEA